MLFNKTLSPDGLNLASYKCLKLCRTSVVSICKRWLEENTILMALGEASFVLISKCDNPVSMKDLQPISLYNVVYKIVSKVLANRLKEVLSKCILEEQEDFVGDLLLIMCLLPLRLFIF